jgi:hypothetical protein
MTPLADMQQKLEGFVTSSPCNATAAELLGLGEEVLEHWVTAHGQEPTMDKWEGFRLLALHRQGSKGDASFNACRETCRELVYHYNLITMEPDHPEVLQRQKMMAMVSNHLFLFVSGKLQAQELGDFCCSSRDMNNDRMEI